MERLQLLLLINDKYSCYEKLFNNLFFYLLFLGIGTNVLTSCKEEVESISELSLEQTKIQIKEGETVTVKIIGGRKLSDFFIR